MSSPKDIPFVSRAGLKLDHALSEFELDVTGFVCADFGCNIGGFTDCLLQRGAKQIYALDTGYGTLAWKLRSDDRVITMERTNALHAELPEDPHTPFPGVDLVVIDMGWTQQRLAVPAALKWLKTVAPASRLCELTGETDYSTDSGDISATRTGKTPMPLETKRPRIITLIKPHYEASPEEKKTLLKGGALVASDSEMILKRVLEGMEGLGVEVLGHTKSPITGRKSSKSRQGAGNVEYLAFLKPKSPE